MKDKTTFTDRAIQSLLRAGQAQTAVVLLEQLDIAHAQIQQADRGGESRLVVNSLWMRYDYLKRSVA